MHIREAVESDVPELTRVYRVLVDQGEAIDPRVVRFRPTDEQWRSTVAAALSSEREAILVADTDDGIAGFVRLTLTDKLHGTLCEIDTLVVEETARGRGVGGRLLEAAERRGRALGAREFQVDVQYASERARAFYEAHGYERHILRYSKMIDTTDNEGHGRPREEPHG